ncbi:MAG: hypothetical protein COA42_12710 [Alteromonadaceae bacterium]|nr:MAG: hypothetical protein COA42_12710 [Alteromonadaceae bacterium]
MKLSILDNAVKNIIQIIPQGIPPLLMRIGIFFVFWKSVQTKIDGADVAGQSFAFWNVTGSTKMLFEYEYGLPMPEFMAYLGTFGEFFLSIALLLGFMTRLSALGLLVMMAVIQYVYPGAWGLHLVWASILLYLLRDGGGSFSLDKIIK